MNEQLKEINSLTVSAIQKRYCSKFVVSPGGCWFWTGALTGPSGKYGAFYNGLKIVRAHRLAYELLGVPISNKMTIDHLCKITVCVNPIHLEQVTRGEICMNKSLRTYLMIDLILGLLFLAAWYFAGQDIIAGIR